MKYRSRTDIVALILEATQEGAAKTKIMYKAFLSYSQLKDYLSILLERELIEYFDKEQIFRITDKGRRYLYLYSKVMELITPSGDQDLENQIYNIRRYNGYILLFSYLLDFIICRIRSYNNKLL